MTPRARLALVALLLCLLLALSWQAGAFVKARGVR